MLASTAGGRLRSPVKGLPGASRIIKNEMVIKKSMVGMASNTRLKMSLNISSLLLFANPWQITKAI